MEKLTQHELIIEFIKQQCHIKTHNYGSKSKYDKPRNDN